MRKLLVLVLLLFAASPAQAAYFGKNKVQYKKFRWHVLETQHFDIMFYDGEAETVQDAARMAERSYAQLARTLGHEFAKKIPLILYASHSDFQQTNITEGYIDVGTGGVTELVRRRVFLPFTGSYAELEHVLTHELTHAFELDILYDPEATDPVSPFGYQPPLWVMEGLAEYLSRGTNDTHTDMWVRDACLSGTLPTLQQLGFAQDIRVYRFGQSVWQYFAAEYGTPKIGELLREMRDKKSLEKAFESIAKIPLSEFSEKWGMAMRRQALPGIANHRTTREFSKPVVTRRADESWLVLSPSISPDGEKLAYVSDRTLNRDVWVRNIDGAAKARRIVQGEMSGDFEALRFFNAGCAWSPDGKTLALAAKAGSQDALYLVNAADGRIEKRLTFGLDEVQTASFSPDGSELVFVGLAGGQSDLYRVRRDGTGLQRLTQDRYAERDPQWSPDGRSIVYVSDAGPGTDFAALVFERMHLMLLDLETRTSRDITPFEHGKAVSPAWSGDGQYVAFVSDRDGASNIYILQVATGQAFRLTDSTTGISGILPTSPALSWARASKRLAFSAFGESGWDIYRIDDPLAAMTPLELEPGDMAPVAELAFASAAAASGAAGPMVSTDGAALEGGAIPAAPDAAADTTASVTPAPVPAAAAPDSFRFRVRNYRPRLSPDLSSVGGVASYEAGFGGQSQIHFSDLLGDHNLGVGLGIYGSLKDSDLFLSYLNRAHRTSWSVSGFQFRKRYGMLGSARQLEIEHQTYRGVQVAVQHPFDRFSRLEATLQLAGVSGRFFLGETATDANTDPGIHAVRSFVGPGLAYVFDSSLWGATGPVKGRRMRVALAGGVGQIDYVTLETDLRQYWNLRKWYTVAARLYGSTSSGNTPQTMYLGGAQSLRGYDYGELVGNHALLANLEFRFPLVRHLALGWPLPLELGNVQGVLFTDAATAWDHEAFRTSRAVRAEVPGRAPLVSTGFGVRVGLGYMVLKLDWAQRYDTGNGDRSSGSNVSLGFDF